MSYRLFLERLAPSASRNVLKTLVQSVESTVEDADKFRAFAKDEKVPVLIFYESQPSTTPNGPIRVNSQTLFLIASGLLKDPDRNTRKRL